jgi:hypothetical protein
MNFCIDCNSLYSRPGTCNCWAPGGKRDPARLVPAAPATGTIPYAPDDGGTAAAPDGWVWGNPHWTETDGRASVTFPIADGTYTFADLSVAGTLAIPYRP